MKTLHVLLRPGFGVCLFLSQFASQRHTFFSGHRWMIVLGMIITIAGLALWLSASIHLGRAKESGAMATSGPFQSIRHPIYVSIYLLSIGLGLLFFAWLWFLVMAAFIPFWWLESKAEEQAMLGAYGEQYIAYQQRTKMFIPGVI